MGDLVFRLFFLFFIMPASPLSFSLTAC